MRCGEWGGKDTYHIEMGFQSRIHESCTKCSEGWGWGLECILTTLRWVSSVGSRKATTRALRAAGRVSRVGKERTLTTLR